MQKPSRFFLFSPISPSFPQFFPLFPIFPDFVPAAFPNFWQIFSLTPHWLHHCASAHYMPLHELKSSTRELGVHLQECFTLSDTCFNWSSENALHERFIAEQRRLSLNGNAEQLIPLRWKNASVFYSMNPASWPLALGIASLIFDINLTLRSSMNPAKYKLIYTLEPSIFSSLWALWHVHFHFWGQEAKRQASLKPALGSHKGSWAISSFWHQFFYPPFQF